ncbi:unnamed protein product [Camellia sinensis]
MVIRVAFGRRNNMVYLNLGPNNLLLISKKKITSYREIDTLVSYDPKSEQVKNLGVTRSPISFYVDNFVESLVLLDLVNGEFGRQPNCGEKKMLKGKWKIEEEHEEQLLWLSQRIKLMKEANCEALQISNLEGTDYVYQGCEEEEEMSDYLPEEVWIRNILPTLSIKTLLRCTSVCKSWYSLITSPSFISTHLNRNKQHDPPLLLLRHCSERPRKEHFSIHHDNPTLDDYAKLDFPFHSVNCYFRIVGSCNGVVCLSDDHMCYVHTIILWNPSIRKSFNLPRPSVVFQTHGPFVHSIGFGFGFGFGFDSINHECKVVRAMSKMMMVLTLFHPRLSFTRSAGDVGKALVIVVFKALFPSDHHRFISMGLYIGLHMIGKQMAVFAAV